MIPIVLRRTGVWLRRVVVSLTVAFGLSGGFGVGARPASADAAKPPRPGPAGSARSGASAACAEAIARRVETRYADVKSLEARFTQRSRRVAFGNEGGDVLVSHGKVVFERPGRMRWSYTSPKPSLVVSDGTSVWIYDPETQEAQHLPLGKRFLSGAAVQFLVGRGHILDEFRVAADSCSGNPVRLVLTPRKDASYDHLELNVDPETGRIQATTMVDLFGNRTHVVFDDVRTNVAPDPSLFRFKPPPGARVIEVPATSPAGGNPNGVR